MTIGTEIRLHRILRKGRMLCIPMDHGISNGPIEGLEKPHSMIYKCESHGITSVIINKGIIKTLPRPPKVGILAHFSAVHHSLLHQIGKYLLVLLKRR